MKNMHKARRFIPSIIAVAAFIVFILLFPKTAPKAVVSLGKQLGSMLLIIPPIFLMLGLLDVWVKRETFIRYMGAGSGIKGKLLAFVLGSAAAGPLYAAFPVAAVLMNKGAGFTNIMIFIGAWSTTKIPMLLFEMESLGVRFALARLLIDIPGIILIAVAMKTLVPGKEVAHLYENMKKSHSIP